MNHKAADASLAKSEGKDQISFDPALLDRLSEGERLRTLDGMLFPARAKEMVQALDRCLALAGSRQDWLLAVAHELLDPFPTNPDRWMVVRHAPAYKAACGWLIAQKQLDQALALGLAKQAAHSDGSSMRELLSTYIAKEAGLVGGVQAQAAKRAGQYLTQGEAADYLKVSRQTLAKWRDQGRIPCSRPSLQHVLYAVADLDAFLDSEKGPIKNRPVL